MNKFEIVLIKNGPLKLIRINKNKEVSNDILFDEKEKSIPIKNITTLCRCGQSLRQPYCDGTHKKINFDSSNNLKKEIIQYYKGKEIDIIFNRSICSGAGLCVKSFSNIYQNASENWIHPDKGSIGQIKESIKMCPSGALSYKLNNQISNEEYKTTQIKVIVNGPFRVEGNIKLNIDIWPSNANKHKYGLCSCGKSKNKPFCDYSHMER